jgi:hypothetical protein
LYDLAFEQTRSSIVIESNQITVIISVVVVVVKHFFFRMISFCRLIRIANQNAGKEAGNQTEKQIRNSKGNEQPTHDRTVAMFKNIMIYMGDQPIPSKGVCLCLMTRIRFDIE